MPIKNKKIKNIAAPYLFNNHEDALVAQKLARLDAFTTFNPRPIIEVDYKGNVLDENKSAKRLFPDLKRKGPKHKYLVNLNTVVNHLVKEEKPLRRDIKIGKRWFKQVFYHIPQFKLIHIYGSDGTKRKQSEEYLKKSEKRYHMLFNKMSYAYALQDIIFNKNKKPVDYRFVDVNLAFEKLFDVKKELVIGKTINDLTNQDQQTEEEIKYRKQYDKVALTGKPIQFEIYNQKMQKHLKIFSYKPNEKQISLIFSDITKEKNAGKEKDNFISIMSHELRNPLTPILANAQFINSIVKSQKGFDQSLQESIDIIEKQARIMADLLNDILDVSRLDRNIIKLKKRKVNICEVIKNSVKASVPFVNSKNQKLSVFFNQNPIYANVDPTRIEQIIINLINNASKYTNYRGSIELTCGVIDEKVEIRVKDNGIGMTSSKIKRMFDLFEGDHKPLMGIGGLGIGLNIVKKLVLMHKGNVTAKSKGKNKGSEFIIEIPLIKNYQMPDDAVARGKKQKTTLKNELSKVLIVEDNKDIRDSISKILSHRGHEVKMTHMGLTAIKISKKFKPNVALIDIGLPDINGYKVAKILKEQNKNKKIKLIAFTGYGQEKDKLLSKEAGFDHHLTKPIDINDLTRLIS